MRHKCAAAPMKFQYSAMSHSKLEKVIDSHAKQIEEVDQTIIIDVAGVSQAMDELRKALDDIRDNLDKRNYDTATEYGACVNSFIFLQRALAGLQIAVNDKHALIQDIALQTTGMYEEVAPHVEKRLVSSQPLTEEQRKQNLKAIEEFKKSGKSVLDFLAEKEKSS